jgi:hypothetical protein
VAFLKCPGAIEQPPSTLRLLINLIVSSSAFNRRS